MWSAMLLEQPALEVSLLRVGAQREEVEDVGVLQALLGEVGVGRRERGLEIRQRLASAPVQAGLDLCLENRTAPSVLDGPPRVPQSLVCRRASGSA
jgi:hypothetical protein